MPILPKFKLKFIQQHHKLPTLSKFQKPPTLSKLHHKKKKNKIKLFNNAPKPTWLITQYPKNFKNDNISLWNFQWNMLGHMYFSCYRTYVMILCNWLIFWQNALYLYLGRLRIVKLLQETTFQDLVLKPSSLFKKSSKECKIIKARQLVDTCSTPPICRGLRFSDFSSNFLRIRESVYGPSFLLTLDI